MNAPEKVKVLFLGANPRTTAPLALDEEIRAITEKIRLATGRELIQVVQALAVRPNDLLQQLLQHRPHVIHFSGHGNEAGEIVLVNDQGQTQPVSAEALKDLFTTLKDNIRLVFLNACYTHTQSEAIAEVIDFVISMGTAISDQAARVFAAAFYQGLAFHRSVQESFALGRIALQLERIPEKDTPQLLVRAGMDATAVVLVPAEAQEMRSALHDLQTKATKVLAQLQAISFAFRQGNYKTANDEKLYLGQNLNEYLDIIMAHRDMGTVQTHLDIEHGIRHDVLLQGSLGPHSQPVIDAIHSYIPRLQSALRY